MSSGTQHLTSDVTSMTRLAAKRRTWDRTITVAALLSLLAVGVLAWGPVFGGLPGWIAAGGGVLLGCLIALLTSWRRWSALIVAVLTLIGYLLFGTALALPKTAIAGVLPSLDSLQRLAALIFQGWRDLLTVSTPASNFTGPAAVPLMTGLVCSVLAVSLGVRAAQPLWALLPTTLGFVVALAWGTQRPLWAAPLGLAYAIIALAWAAWLRQAQSTRDPDGVLHTDQKLSWIPQTARGAGVILLATAVAWPVATLLGTPRHVLRDQAEPPFDLRKYSSPLVNFRYWEVDQKEATLFTVTGLPEGERLRLATLDQFDGNVYNVTASSAGFFRAGEKMDGLADGTSTQLDVTVGDYRGYWLPGAGEWRGVRFVGPQANRQLDGLYYNSYGATALTTNGIRSGDAYTLQLVSTPPVGRQGVGNKPVMDAPQPANAQVPEVVGRTAADWVGTAETPLDKAQHLEARFREGYYSNGSDGKSRPGHTAERIGSMLSAPILIGDDEQYAVAMALMAREVGLPARVVVGFYPDPKDATQPVRQFTGNEAHAWVEIAFADSGWVTFDPTPDRDRVPQTEQPKPKPNPQPMVQPPPEPPTADLNEDAEPRLVNRKPEPRRNGDWIGWLIMAGKVAGLAAAAASPFLAILLAKRRRRTLRRTADDPRNRSGGSWDELMDAAIDLGMKPPKGATRREEAVALIGAYPAARAIPKVAKLVDHQVFGPATPDDPAIEAAWRSGTEARREIGQLVKRRQRITQFLSLRSFWRGRLPDGWLPAPRLPRRTSEKVES